MPSGWRDWSRAHASVIHPVTRATEFLVELANIANSGGIPTRRDGRVVDGGGLEKRIGRIDESQISS
jgi:hypothetical protein